MNSFSIAASLTDIQRDYLFTAQIVPSFNTDIAEGWDWVHWEKLPIVNSLAMSVAIPERKIEFESQRMSVVDVKFPRAIKTDDIKLVYIENGLNSVTEFFSAWQQSLVEGNGLNFKEIGRRCLSLIFTPIVDLGASSPTTSISVPTMLLKWKYVYPSDISIGSYSKEGTALKKVTVTLVRPINLIISNGAFTKVLVK